MLKRGNVVFCTICICIYLEHELLQHTTPEHRRLLKPKCRPPVPLDSFDGCNKANEYDQEIIKSHITDKLLSRWRERHLIRDKVYTSWRKDAQLQGNC